MAEDAKIEQSNQNLRDAADKLQRADDRVTKSLMPPSSQGRQPNLVRRAEEVERARRAQLKTSNVFSDSVSTSNDLRNLGSGKVTVKIPNVSQGGSSRTFSSQPISTIGQQIRKG